MRRFFLFVASSGAHDPCLELALGRSLIGADAAGDDIGTTVVFSPDGASGDTSKNVDLADMSVGVGDSAAKQARDRHGDRGAGCEIFIKLVERGEETRRAGLPFYGGRVTPSFFSFGLRERPIEQITEVSEDLGRRARFRAGLELGEISGYAAESFRAAIGDRSDSLTEERVLRIVCCGG